MDRLLIKLYVLIGFAIFSTVSTLSFERNEEPEKCCAPPVFETELKFLGHTDFGMPVHNKQKALLIVDQKNQRWLLNQTAPRDRSYDSKLIYDYKMKERYLITEKGCFSTPVEGEMRSFCIPANATFYGRYSYGRAGFDLDFDTWGWNMEGAFIKLLSKVTRKTPSNICFPLQDDVFATRPGKFSYVEGNPPCIPWKDRDTLASGNCYKCTSSHPVTKTVATLAQHVSHIQYTNYFNGMHMMPFFDIPENCTKMDEWNSQETLLNAVQKYYTVRFQD